MYKAMWDNINRHVTVLWQAAAVLGTAFGAALLLKGDGSIAANPVADVAVAVVIAASFWLMSHAFDASLWMNRNIQIISNIEAELLPASDKTKIHPYIGFSKSNEMSMHIRIQASLGVIVGLAAYSLHFEARVWDTIDPSASFDFGRALPSIVLILGAAAVSLIRRSSRASYDEFFIELGKQPPAKKPNALRRLIDWLRPRSAQRTTEDANSGP